MWCEQAGQLVTAAAFAPSRALLATATWPGTIQLFNVESCVPALRLRHSQAEAPPQLLQAPGGITGIAFQPNLQVR